MTQTQATLNRRTPKAFLYAVAGSMVCILTPATGVRADDRVLLHVRETAGIRRFGYPVSALLKLDPPAPAGTRFRLLQADVPTQAQFRPVEKGGDRLVSVSLDFDSNFTPNESRTYVVEYGESVVAGPEPNRGMKVDESNDAWLISNGPNLVWTIPKDLAGLLRSVKTAKWDYLRAGSAGLALRLKDGQSIRIDGAGSMWATTGTVIKDGPIDCSLRFDSRGRSRQTQEVASTVELGFPRSKSWVRVTWTIDDPQGNVAGVAADLNLQVGAGPTLVDFGVDSLVYATVPDGQVAVLEAGSIDKEQAGGRLPQPFWRTLRGRADAPEPYVTGPEHATPVQGWAHVMDRERATAVAVEGFARDSRDRIQVDSDGRLQIVRDYARVSVARSRSAKQLVFWLHFVPFPPHVGAVTSPQSMQAPLEVRWDTGESKAKTDVPEPNGAEADDKIAALPSDKEMLAARAASALAKTAGEIRLGGLKDKVEVLRDRWGVPHIYAENSHDLFFAQGFVQAQDRLWQMEIWRRATEGKLAEIIGPAAFERDRFARLIEYRGDMEREWTSYSPDSQHIIESFVSGVNAFIDLCQDNPPLEFQLTGLRPQPWTARVCLGRMAGFIMCRNASNEVLRAELLRELGAEEAARLLPINPSHEIQIPAGLDLDGIDQRVVAGISAANAAIRVPLAQDPVAQSRNRQSLTPSLFGLDGWGEGGEASELAGSNNWTIAGRHTTTGKPILANDPHRAITVPSLRYIVHLNCPTPSDIKNAPARQSPPAAHASAGWNVIGGTEPALPGVAIGHNERIAWGFTIVGTDQTDIFVEETHPDDPNRYRVAGEWHAMRIERQAIRVRGESEPRATELKFTRHGPVIFEDLDRHRAYSLRWIGSEPGTAGYLGALAVNRAGNWQEFLAAAARWKLPSENMVYADVDGHIGWIAAALTPVRSGWDGLLPVPGASGQFDWQGFVPLAELPQRFDPPEGYIATANHNILPPGYRHMLSYEWSPPFRFQRIDAVLRRQIELRESFSIQDSQRLQHDATSVAAIQLIALLRQVNLDGETFKRMLSSNHDAATRLRTVAEMLSAWDGKLSRDSAPAALAMVWQRRLNENVLKPRIPERLWERYSTRSPLVVTLELLRNAAVGGQPDLDRDEVMLDALRQAVEELAERQGPDPAAWRLSKLHEAHFRHMLATPLTGQRNSSASSGGTSHVERNAEPARDRAALAAVFNLPSVARDGDAFAPIATGGSNYQQTSGASYRHIIDLSDWDRSVATSVPGQSGQPRSPHYGDLLALWANGEYFPLLFSRAAVEAATTQRLVLRPKGE
jgi:penicillin amidase